MKKFFLALAILLPLSAFSAPAAESRLQKAREAFAKGDEDTARTEIKALIKEDPKNPAPFLLLGELTKKDGDATTDSEKKAFSYKMATMSLEKAITLDGKNPATYFDAANVYLLLNDPVKASDYFKKTLALSPDYPGAKAQLQKAEAKITKK